MPDFRVWTEYQTESHAQGYNAIGPNDAAECHVSQFISTMKDGESMLVFVRDFDGLKIKVEVEMNMLPQLNSQMLKM